MPCLRILSSTYDCVLCTCCTLALLSRQPPRALLRAEFFFVSLDWREDRVGVGEFALCCGARSGGRVSAVAGLG